MKLLLKISSIFETRCKLSIALGVDQNDLPRILCLIFKAKRLLKANFDLIFSYYPEKLLRCITLGFDCRKYKNLLCAWERTLKMKCFQTLLIETLQREKI